MSVAGIARRADLAATRTIRPHLSARFITLFIANGNDGQRRSFTRPSGPTWCPATNSAATKRCTVKTDPHPIATTRHFSASQCLSKKGGKAIRQEKQAAGQDTDVAGEDPFDFSALESDIAAVIERLKSDLSKLRAGGRFNPEVVENLRVQPDKKTTQTVKLSDLAQVIPKGRTVQILVGERDHVKPITSAIQASSLSLTPQPDPTGANPLLLVLHIPPPTAESRKAVVAEAARAGEKAGTSVRDARGRLHKKLRAMAVNRSARPDDVKKANGLMEKAVEKGNGEVKKIVDNAKKVLETA